MAIGIVQMRFGVHDAHAAAATTAGSLDDDRITDLAGDATVSVASSPSGPPEPGTQGTPAAFMALIAALCRPSAGSLLAVGPMKMNPDCSLARQSPHFQKEIHNPDGLPCASVTSAAR